MSAIIKTGFVHCNVEEGNMGRAQRTGGGVSTQESTGRARWMEGAGLFYGVVKDMINS